MNKLRIFYCRTVQTVFRVAIPFLPYRKPKILLDVQEVSDLLTDKGKRRVLIVTDSMLHKAGLLETLKTSLTAAGISYFIYDKTVPNPTINNVEESVSMYRKNGCQAIIAFGGGSSMDCAKATGARIAKPRQSIQRMAGVMKIWKKTPMLIAVPTTAGTGSETTVTAVITDDATHHKQTINAFALIPEYALLDYKLTVGLPKALTATTGMDALTHAVEAYIGGSTTKESRAMAVETVSLVYKYLKIAYSQPDNKEAREGMLHAAYCAGLAFSKSYVGYVHAVAHSLGGQYKIPHGLANSVLLPIVLEIYGESCHRRLANLARKSGVVVYGYSDKETSERFIAWIKQMNSSMSIPEKLEGIQDDDIDVMAYHADKEANPLYPVPMEMDRNELKEIYKKVQA